VLTDPSYRGQIVTMTAPEIGNVGVNPVDFESPRPWCAGFVVRELSPLVSNWRSTGSLHSLLADHGVAGISGIDTRAVTRRIRLSGAQRAVITRAVDDPAAAVERARKHPSLEGRDLVREVTAAQGYEWNEPVWGGPNAGRAELPPERFTSWRTTSASSAGSCAACVPRAAGSASCRPRRRRRTCWR
jgi:carbamoyl-phosphate synthase small subunit